MSNDFTPGPWTIGYKFKSQWHDTIKIYGKGAVQICQVSTDGQRNDSEINKANAYLIAAAPDLLEACQEFMDCEPYANLLGGNEHVIDMIKAAIAKAKG